MIIDGKATAEELRHNIAVETAKLTGRKPTLAAVLVGENPASKIYVRNKIKACEEVGFHSRLLPLPESASESELLQTLISLNKDPNVDGILLQLPLPDHINPQKMVDAIDPKKDVDGLHPINMGLLLNGEKVGFAPCTPLGIRHLLVSYGIGTSGKHVVIAGRSNIVGKPLAAMLMQKEMQANATVTLVHSCTVDIATHTKQADILVAAIGHPEFFKADMVKEGCVIIDVGINRIPDETAKRGYRLTGDVDFEDVKEKCCWISPVPKGVGPMTIAMLLRNTLIAYQRHEGLPAWTW